MILTPDRIKQFRTLGHALKPIVTVAGNGLSENVLAELERALSDHELVKVKLAILERDTRKSVVEDMCKRCNAKLIQEIGKVALIFREAEQPDPKKSNIR